MNKTTLTVISVIVIAAALLFGGAGITAYAAQSSLPGDTLYGVKTTLEQTRLSMSQDASTRAELYMDFAETRLQEVSRLIAEQRYQDISRATTDFESYTQKAIAELETVAKGDPEKAAVLTAKISEALSRYARALTSMLASVPEPVKAQLEQVIQSSQNQSSPVTQSEVEFSGVVETIVEGAWIIAGKTVFIHSQTEIKGNVGVGDFVKVHAAINSDGDLVAREIELDDADDNSNVNSNENNDNDNMNSNDDDDNNSNDDNSNDDDSNSNDDNSNDDSNSNNDNSNDDDDSNANDDDSNANDDDSNDNDDDSNDDNGNDSNDDNGNDSYDDSDDDDDHDSNDNSDDD